VNIEEFNNYSDLGIVSDQEIKFETFTQKDWKIFWTNEKMFSSKNLDLIAPTLKVPRLPEMVYGYNRFTLINEKKDFLFDVNTFDMLDLSSFKERDKYYLEKGKVNVTSSDKKRKSSQKPVNTREYTIFLRNLKYNSQINGKI